MSRTILLSRFHALNWYGYKDTIPVEGNLLLAGVTGSGKSILMDLIQLVLVGDQRLVRFNQSATGDRSDRTLKGYCLGDTKQEEAGVTQYMRKSAISYVALEFTWPNGKRKETWGMRIEFASAAETHGKITPFFVPCGLERSDFLDAEKRPLDYPAFRAFVDQSKGRFYTEGVEAYLRDMAQPSHLNFDRNILRALMPTAMSFTFLRSFNEFARSFILPSDKLDIADVTASYRAFQAYERDLRELKDQFGKLQEIRDWFTTYTNAGRDRSLARYLEAELRLEHSSANLRETENKLESLRKECAEQESRLKVLLDEISNSETRLKEISTLINQTPEGQIYTRIQTDNTRLSHQISNLSGIGATLDQAISNRIRNARSWADEVRQAPWEMEPEPLAQLDAAIRALESGGVEKSDTHLPALAKAAQEAASHASRAAGEHLAQLRKIRAELGSLREEIAALRVGKLPFPTRLLDALNQRLPAKGKTLPAEPLCKLCEVTDERWRPAIEVAFTRKFAVVVDQTHYREAEDIYRNLSRAELDAGRESLVHPAKALKRQKEIKPGALAEKLRTSHPIAAAIVSQLFGDLMCVEKAADLEQHDFAILPDGFMTRGAFVERARFYDGNPFVGKEGLKQQLIWKEQKVGQLQLEEGRIEPVERQLKTLNDGLRDHFEIPSSLYTDLAAAKELPRLKRELDKNIADLKTIDRARFETLAEEQGEIEGRLKKLLNEQREIDRSEKRVKLEQSLRHVENLKADVESRQQAFEKVRGETDVSKWLGRLKELRSEMLERFPSLDVAAKCFNSQLQEFNEEAIKAWGEVKAKRRELAISYPKFDDLDFEAAENSAYDRHLEKLDGSDIPDYADKAERERKNWESLFRTQVLEKLHNALHEVRNLIELLNESLKKRPIGSHRYQLRSWTNPDYKTWHELLEASAHARADDLFFASAEPRFRDAIDHFLTTLTDRADSVEAARLLDYRHYYEYDMDVLEEDGRKVSVDRHSGKMSGGENQSPYFIAILASYLRAYRRYGKRRTEPTLGIVPIDEAFSKLSGERIKDCISALKAFDLQGVFSMSTGNIPYAFEHCDWLIVVSKDERRNGGRLEIRNVPVSLARDSEEARRLMD